MSAHITPAFGPDYFPLTVANRILGGGTNSHMFMDIREKRGYAYDAHSETHQMRDAGVAVAVTQVRNEVAGAAVEALNENLKDIGTTEVKPVELSEAKASYAGRFILDLERQSGRASQLSAIEIEKLPPDYLDTFMTHIQSVEPDQLRKAARFFAPDDATLVVVGDASKIQNQFTKFGDVQVVQPKQ
jgi:predicted Zn-dependent peptidase